MVPLAQHAWQRRKIEPQNFEQVWKFIWFVEGSPKRETDILWGDLGSNFLKTYIGLLCIASEAECWFLVSKLPQAFQSGAMKRNHLLVTAGIWTWNVWTSARMKRAVNLVSACCSAFPLKDMLRWVLSPPVMFKWWGCGPFAKIKVVCVQHVSRAYFLCCAFQRKWESSYIVIFLQGFPDPQLSDGGISNIYSRRTQGPSSTVACGLSAACLGFWRSPLCLGGHSLFTFCEGHLSISLRFTPGY